MGTLLAMLGDTLYGTILPRSNAPVSPSKEMNRVYLSVSLIMNPSIFYTIAETSKDTRISYYNSCRL
jgi:hypothetical protein